MQRPGVFITLEGVEGVGKTSVAEFLHHTLLERGITVCATREPGGTEVAEAIRQVLLNHHQEPVSDDCELLLMFAARSQHLEQKIKPALARGEWVLCDRFTDASYAYQGGGRQQNLERIELLENWVQGSLRPDLTFLLDTDLKTALQRAQKRSEPDRIEAQQYEFFKRVQATYQQRAKAYPQRIKTIDVGVPFEQVTAQILKQLDQWIESHGRS